MLEEVTSVKCPFLRSLPLPSFGEADHMEAKNKLTKSNQPLLRSFRSNQASIK